MGINSYGLFGGGRPQDSYNDRNYELQRQLQARQQQLGELDRMPSLSAAQQEKRRQLLNAVDHLTGELNPAKGTSASETSLNGIGRRDTEDGIVIPKNRMDVAKAYANMDPNAKKRPNPGYAQNEYSNSGSITYKNPTRYDGGATTPQDTYLKGFFVDIKL